MASGPESPHGGGLGGHKTNIRKPAWQLLPPGWGWVPTLTGFRTHFKCVATAGRCRLVQGWGAAKPAAVASAEREVEWPPT
jgi:hypothetical protein